MQRAKRAEQKAVVGGGGGSYVSPAARKDAGVHQSLDGERAQLVWHLHVAHAHVATVEAGRAIGEREHRLVARLALLSPASSSPTVAPPVACCAEEEEEDEGSLAAAAAG